MIAQAFLATVGLLTAPVTANSIAASSLDWEEAVRLADECRAEWTEVWRTLDADAAVCEAIIFPELLRYRRLQDDVELAALLALYVRGGTEAANYSVGKFQMKPSFAEEVERAWMRSPLRHTYRLYFDLRDDKLQRNKRVERLRDERWQCVYIAIFVRLLLEREPSWANLDADSRIRLFVTAYNHRFTASTEELKRRQGRKHFHLDLFRTKSTTCYSYAELASRRYKELTDKY